MFNDRTKRLTLQFFRQSGPAVNVQEVMRLCSCGIGSRLKETVRKL